MFKSTYGYIYIIADLTKVFNVFSQSFELKIQTEIKLYGQMHREKDRSMHSGSIHSRDTVPLAYQLVAKHPLVLSSQALDEKARKLGY